jgi:glycosyltransferase involved in cell wall biosynthesis
VRLAWLGPTPSEDGGAPGVGTILLRELARLGHEVDCFIAARPEDIPSELRREPGLSFHLRDSGWRWGRWYSRRPMLAFFSGNLARIRAQMSLADAILHEHRRRPYDLVYQFSQSELTALRRRARQLPPIVVHPSTHAAGELRWHRAETALSRRCEPAHKRFVVRAMLMSRAAAQRRDMRLACRVLPVGEPFRRHIARDYGVEESRLGVVLNPIDLARFSDVDRIGPPTGGPIDLLFVSRISARKGVEMITALSRRMSDLSGRVRIRVIGGPTSWSDYRPLLADLDPRTATYDGRVSPDELARLFKTAGGLLLPSRYEPFGLTVAEALASGVPVVASDEVGAADGLDDRVCRIFPEGDLDQFELQVRALVATATGGVASELAAIARAEACRLYAPAVVARRLVEELQTARSACASP